MERILTNLYCIVEVGQHQSPSKIGISRHVNKRISSLQGGNWRKIEFAWRIITDATSAEDTEQYLLRVFRPSPYDCGTKAQLCSEWVEASSFDVRKSAIEYLNALEAEWRAA